MKAKNTIRESRTDWNRLETMSDSDIDFSDVSRLDKTFFSRAQVRMPSRKKAVSIRLDADVLDWFKHEEKQYQTKINAVLRRYSVMHGNTAAKIREQGLELDPAARTAKLDGRTITLTRKEFDLLTLMLEKKGRVLGVPYMLETIWGYNMATYDNPHTVESHMSSLRKKLGPKLGPRIVNVTGHGYKFV